MEGEVGVGVDPPHPGPLHPQGRRGVAVRASVFRSIDLCLVQNDCVPARNSARRLKSLQFPSRENDVADRAPLCCAGSGWLRQAGGAGDRRARRHSRSRFRPLYRGAVLRGIARRSRRRGHPHRADGRRRGSRLYPGRCRAGRGHRPRRRRDVPGDEPQQARDDARPGRTQRPRDRPPTRRHRRCRRREPAAAGVAVAGARSRQPAPSQARHHLDDGDRLWRRRAAVRQARLRRDRPSDVRCGLFVGHAGAADSAQTPLGRFRHRLSVGFRHAGGADRARQDRARPESRGRPAAHRDRLC